MGGAFQTSREIFSNPIWTDVIKFRLFFFIYGNAVFSDEGVKVGNITLKRGQFLRSYRNLANDLQYLDNRSLKIYSISVLKKKVDQLVKENRLKVEDTELGTLFTVVNYSLYQGFEHYKNRTENGARTGREQRENNNNKVKNVKNENKTYINLKIDGSNFLNIYNQQFFRKFNKQHMQIPEEKNDFILSQIEEVELWSGVDTESFKEITRYHFDHLSKNNDGNILAFIPALPRYLQMLQNDEID